MTERERLDFLIDNLESGVAKRFAQRIGVSLPTISRIRSGELRLLPRADRILKAYPQVSRDWLYSGQGYPGDLNVEMVAKRLGKIISEKDRTIATLSEQIARLLSLIEKNG